jgi:N-acetylglucosaminyl-diphospho-decaprenol L-rhamnosyltransferase
VTPTAMGTNGSGYAAVILYYRLGDRVHDTIAALQRQEIPPEQILVVDNASGDGVLDDIAARHPSTALLTMSSNVGYPAAMNAGAEQLVNRYEYVLFLTHEVLMRPDCTKRLLAVLRQHEQMGMVGPALRVLTTDTTWSLGGRITRLGEVYHNQSTARVDDIEWLDGACLLIRSSTFVDVGGFDEDYFLYWEDVDISIKIRSRNLIKCVPEAIAYQGTLTASIYLRTRNQILCWRKHGGVFRIIAALIIATAKIFLVDLAGRSPTQAKARTLGVIHGLSGRLTTSKTRLVRQGRL